MSSLLVLEMITDFYLKSREILYLFPSTAQTLPFLAKRTLCHNEEKVGHSVPCGMCFSCVYFVQSCACYIFYATTFDKQVSCLLAHHMMVMVKSCIKLRPVSLFCTIKLLMKLEKWCVVEQQNFDAFVKGFSYIKIVFWQLQILKFVAIILVADQLMYPRQIRSFPWC